MPTPRPHRPGPTAGSSPGDPSLRVRIARPEDIPELITLSREIYAPPGAWLTPELRAHQQVFPEGQLVVEDRTAGTLLGMAASLVIRWADWPPGTSWAEITDDGRFTTHGLEGGDTLYGAGIAVHPEARGRGVARLLYRAREALLERLGLSWIRAGARIPGYGQVSSELSPEDYVDQVVRGVRHDPTLSFQLHMGFEVVTVARNYLPEDRASRGHAAVVRWSHDPSGGTGDEPGT
jgi:GNAT superfamily N-acetyltransferase